MANSETNRTTAWFIVGFIVIVTAGVIIAGALSSSSSQNNGSNGNSNFVATTAPAITAADWKRGNTSSSVSVIEYGDFECPACAEYQPLVQQLIKDYGSKVEFVFRNFPLYQIHPDAQISSEAAEAAGLQGKYWEMHDLLYSKQNEWVTTGPDQVVAKYFNGYAQSLGLNVAKFDQDISSTLVADKIQVDVTGGNAAQIDHTPTFFVNLKQIPNPTSYDQFKAVLDQALGNANVPDVTVSSTPTITDTSTKK